MGSLAVYLIGPGSEIVLWELSWSWLGLKVPTPDQSVVVFARRILAKSNGECESALEIEHSTSAFEIFQKFERVAQ